MSKGLKGRSYLPPEEPLFRPSNLAIASLIVGIFSWLGLPVAVKRR